ncbi:alpha/beta-hydrolase [Microthyrium microscopicum]|uniref:Alpha/beta-hydrolase n=1 Tax=Microthyrium microscopicum TaxID=703497 RepID=A0A6A6URG4_9PEZI|nr:alpha/beta-hydrolase [Microthyrium microscopicum]
MFFLLHSLHFICLIGQALAAPADLVHDASLEKRALVPNVLSGAIGTVDGALSSVVGGVAADSSEASGIFSAILGAIEDTIKDQVTATPTNIAQATSVVASIFSATPTTIYDDIIKLAANGIAPDATDLANLLVGAVSGPNSETNINLKNPASPIYPKKSSTDPAYTLTETQLRQVIYIPSTFTYGQKPPVILVPGTGATGYQSFDGNFIPLLTGVSYADPVWLNIPIQLLGDAQVNAEYVAYAINYISGISKRNSSIISWSQGGIDTQWALKYFSSTRKVVSNFIAISPDYHGTQLAYLLCPSFPTLPCAPAVIQQEYNSNFIATLRSNGGDSAYVPTTTVYSSTDEIVQPQSGTGASAYLLDARNVGVTNNQVQAVCGGHPAGLFYTHEGVLYNPLAFALAKDALTNGGPGRTSRLSSLNTVCDEVVAPGLNLANVLTTEEAISTAGISVLIYPFKVFVEPPIMSYAAGK